MTPLMRSWVAGQLKYAHEFTWFLAPYINSYKRFQVGTLAPTKIIWSRDNRTAGFRLCGEGIEGHPHRMPHRRRRPQPLSRLRGADRGRACRHRREAGSWKSRSWATPIRRRNCREIPKTLRDATETLAKSKMLKRGARRGCRRALRPHRPMGAVRIRPPHHRLGTAQGVRAVLKLHYNLLTLYRADNERAYNLHKVNLLEDREWANMLPLRCS